MMWLPIIRTQRDDDVAERDERLVDVRRLLQYALVVLEVWIRPLAGT